MPAVVSEQHIGERLLQTLDANLSEKELQNLLAAIEIVQRPTATFSRAFFDTRDYLCTTKTNGKLFHK
jgi:hypothetical protein